MKTFFCGSPYFSLMFLDPYPMLLSADNGGNLCLWTVRPCRAIYKHKCQLRIKNKRDLDKSLAIMSCDVSCKWSEAVADADPETGEDGRQVKKNINSKGTILPKFCSFAICFLGYGGILLFIYLLIGIHEFVCFVCFVFRSKNIF